MLVDTFAMFSFHSLVEVYDPGQTNHATLWLNRHVAQGFVWQPGSIGFGLLHDLGDHFIEIHLNYSFQVQPETVRAISLPFTVPPTGEIEVTDNIHVQKVAVPSGEYALLFEIGYAHGIVPEERDDASFWVRFTFVRQQHVQPAILRADEGLSPAYPLLMGLGE